MCDACRREWDRFVDQDGKPAKRKRKRRAAAHAHGTPRHPDHQAATVGGGHAGAHGHRVRAPLPDEMDDVPLGPASPFEIGEVPAGADPPENAGDANSAWPNARAPATSSGPPRSGASRDGESTSSTGERQHGHAGERRDPGTRDADERHEERKSPAPGPRGNDAAGPTEGERAATGTSAVAVTQDPEEPDAGPDESVRDLASYAHAGTELVNVDLLSTERYLCPRCDAPGLVAVVTDHGSFARCEQCQHAVQDLLSLIPVEPVGVARLTLGQGLAGAVNVALLVLLVVALLASALYGR